MKKHLPLIATLFILLGLVALLEVWAQHRFKPLKFDDSVRQKILAERPDIICVGNSTLGNNLDKERFRKGLEAGLGRPLKITYIISGGMHASWQYLVMKNQIAPSGIKDIPVIFFDYEDFYLRPDSKTATGGKSERTLRINMMDDEEIFLSKIGMSRLYFANGFPYLYSQRTQIKRWVTAELIGNTLRAVGLSKFIDKPRWRNNDEAALAGLLGKLFEGSNFRAGQAGDEERRDRLAVTGENQGDFDDKAEQSFVKELISFRDRYRLIFVLSNSNGGMPLMKDSIQTFSSRFENYLSRHAVGYLDMNRNPQLQDPKLMHDTRHFRKGEPKALNTDLVVQGLLPLLNR